MTIIQIILMFIVPLLLIIYRKSNFINKIGAITWAYLTGIIFALIIFIINKLGGNLVIDSSIGETLSHVAIAISIPLLLFSVNLKEVLFLSKTIIKSFTILIFSVIFVAIITSLTYGKYVIGEDSKVLSAMAVGLYTGGTPNLNAIGSFFVSAKGFDYNLIGIANISDMIFGGIFYLFLLSICKPILSLFLKKSTTTSYLKTDDNIENIDKLTDKIKVKPLIRNILIALLCVIVGFIINIIIWLITGSKDGEMLSNNYLIPVIMITVTILGIALSFNKKVNQVKGNNLVAQYMILVFSFALASSINIENISIDYLKIFGLYTIITTGVLIVHSLLSALFKIDVDCTMVTLTAGVYGPAFVPAITSQIKNEKLTAPGLICGSLGYAIGTFLGILIGYILLI